MSKIEIYVKTAGTPNGAPADKHYEKKKDYLSPLMEAWATAKRATGTRNGLQLT